MAKTVLREQTRAESSQSLSQNITKLQRSSQYGADLRTDTWARGTEQRTRERALASVVRAPAAGVEGYPGERDFPHNNASILHIAESALKSGKGVNYRLRVLHHN